MTPLRIHVLALRDCTAFVPVGLVDLLRKSAAMAARCRGRTRGAASR